MALAGVFFSLGFIGASWISRIPQIQDSLAMTNSMLGVALVGLPVGSVAVSLVLPRVVERHARRIMLVGLPVAALSLCLIPIANGAAGLLVALVVVGFTTAGVDVAMNAQAVLVQQQLPRSVISRWHAMWSAGGFAGAAAGAAFAATTKSLWPHFIVVLIAVVLAATTLRRRLAPDPAEPIAGERRSWSRDRRVLLYAAVSVAGFAVEVCAADWGGVFLRRVVGTTVSTAALAYAAFALPHFLARLCGDAVIARWSRSHVMATGLFAAALGYVVLVTSTTTAQVFVALALCGAAISLVVPVALLAAGTVPGVPSGAGVATAAGISYAGWSATPPLVGAVAGAAGLRVALVVPMAVALLCAGLVAAARTSRTV
jgi:predicted MFS family arabinose efflux permease